jgi:hypothetical protein
MPAAMVLPMAAAMPNHTPRTFRRPPLERAEVSVLPAVAGAIGGVSAVVLDASIVLDNEGLRGACNDAAMIVAVRKNASWKSLVRSPGKLGRAKARPYMGRKADPSLRSG